MVNKIGDPEEILKDIQNSIEKDKEKVNVPIFKKPYKKLVYIGIMIGVFSQLTGIGTVMYYATDIFRQAGFSTNSAIGQTVAIGFTNLVFTILAMFLIDKVGRKKLLLIGTLGMTIFLGLFAFAFITGTIGGWLLLFLLVGYVAFFASSVGAVVWVLLAEIFPNNIRSRAIAVASFLNWGTTGIIQFLFPIIVGLFSNGVGIGYVFAFFAAMTFSSFFLYRKFLFETKNKTLEQIESENL